MNLEQQITNKQVDTSQLSTYFRCLEKAWCFIAFWKCWILDPFWFSSKATAASSLAKFVEVTGFSSHRQVWNNHLIRWDLQFHQYLLIGVDIVLAMLSKGLLGLVLHRNNAEGCVHSPFQTTRNESLLGRRSRQNAFRATAGPAIGPANTTKLDDTNMQFIWNCPLLQSRGLPWADLELKSCRHLLLHHPRSRRIRLLESQQMHHAWPEPAGRS